MSPNPSSSCRGRRTRRATSIEAQAGVGLVEVMVALAIVVFVAVVTANTQVTALVGARSSELHFALDRLSGEMIETLRTHAGRARDGEFDRVEEADEGGGSGERSGTGPAGDDDADPATASTADGVGIDELSTEWHRRVVEAIHGAGTTIACHEDFCTIEITWPEAIDGALRRQQFRTGTPI